MSRSTPIWRLNLRDQSFKQEPMPAAWDHLGGRGLSARILLDELDPGVAPLDAGNKLVMAPGLLAGHRLSSCDRLSIGGKSPLTEGIKEANAGGRTARHLVRLGIRVLILEGRAAEDECWLIHLDRQGAHYHHADDLRGLGVYAVAPLLLERFGPDVAIVLIGPAGERGLKAAGIQNLDADGIPSRMAARGGLGAVMGSKGVKAIVIDAHGAKNPRAMDVEGLREARRRYHQALLSHPQTETYRSYGTAAMMMMCNTAGALPTRNFSAGEFEAAGNLSGESLREVMVERGKPCDPSHACMAGCVIQCSNVYATTGGATVLSPLEYETLGLMGSNLGLGDPDAVAKLNYLCNDLGLDSIEIGAALGIAAETGKMAFGDALDATALMLEIACGSPLGLALGNGLAATGAFLGVERIPVAKGQAMSAYDPRAIKGTGVTYATSPQGADHTAGLTIRAKIDHLKPEGQAALSRSAQYKMAGYDSLGACIFASFGFGLDQQLVPDLVMGIHGLYAGVDYLEALGRETILLEREFNRRAGFTAEHDRLPAWMTTELLPPHNTTFDVPDTDLEALFDEDEEGFWASNLHSSSSA